MWKGLLLVVLFFSVLASRSHAQGRSAYDLILAANSSHRAGFGIEGGIPRTPIEYSGDPSFEQTLIRLSREYDISVLPPGDGESMREPPRFGVLKNAPVAAASGILIVYRSTEMHYSQAVIHFECCTLLGRELKAYGPRLELVEEFNGAENTPRLDSKNWKVNDKRLRRFPLTLEVFRVTAPLRRAKVKFFFQPLLSGEHSEIDIDLGNIPLQIKEG